MKLRYYQAEARDAVYDYLESKPGNPCVVIPTGGGKTPLISSICTDVAGEWGGRVVVLAHVKELLEQTAQDLQKLSPQLPMGIYSAGLRRRDLNYAVTVAGIQSIFKRACDLGSVNLILVDECFVAGTLISTPSGAMPIEKIQPGMTVHTAGGVGEVQVVSAKPAFDLLTLEFSDGTTVTCTPNHPFFTEQGWKRAGRMEVGTLAFGVESMSVLRGQVPALVEDAAQCEGQSPEGTTLAQAAVLLTQVCEAAGEPGSQGRSAAADQHDLAADRACSESQGWQRNPDGSTDQATAAAGASMGSGVCCGSDGPSVANASEEPQTGHREPAQHDCHRAGRTESQPSWSPTAGCSQNAVPGGTRLVRVSRHERSGPRVVFNLQVSGHPSYFANGLLVHNCHMIPTEDDGMYRQFLADAKVVNPRVRIVGLTATPYRLKAGMICGPDNIFTDICYEVGVAKLIDEGFLSPLVTKGGAQRPNTDKLHLRAGEFIPQEVEQLMLDPQLVLGAVDELVRWTEKRKSVLIFASGIKHAEAIVASMKHRHNLECGIITGETDDLNRAAMIDRFKAGTLRYLVNVNVLTTGFNAPNVDAVCLLRPTCSPGLYYQMVGRGFRLFPEKRDCLVLDFGSNVERHGPVDRIKIRAASSSGKCAPVCKQCPTCQGFVFAGVLTCPDCGHEFPPPVRGEHEAEAAETGILSSQVTVEQKRVQEINFYVHQKKNAPDAPPTMRVEYRIGFNERVSEWICFEHSGWPRNAAEIWWKRRSLEPVPSTVEMAVELARAGALAQTHEIKIERKPGEKWPSLKGYVLGATPPRLESSDNLPEVPAGDFAPDADAAYPSADEVPF